MRAPALLFALLAAGCDTGAAGADGDFGDPYSFRTQNRAVPTLSEGRVRVPVEYAGGCAEHTFRLRSQASGSTTTVWFRHDDGGDTCEALVSETLDAPLPAAAAAADRIRIRVPVSLADDRETTFQLR